MSFWDATGYLASALVIATFGMKAMIPLRVLAVCSNFVFLAYGWGMHLAPVCVLHAILLPMNVWRLWQAL